MTFWYFITCYKNSIRNFQQKKITKQSFTQKFIFPFVAFLYSLSIYAINVGSVESSYMHRLAYPFITYLL